MAKAPPTPKRLRLRLWGLVQGVGFRPHAYALACRYGLGGFVYNDREGVVLEIEGGEEALGGFIQALRTHPPPLARIDGIETTEVACQGKGGEEGGGGEGGEGETPSPPLRPLPFTILPSPTEETTPLLSVGPDMAPCRACLEELLTPPARRFLYPFLNCTHCGPRYTLSLRAPWDRPNTTLADFAMCSACHAEYANPLDRRFHAQPIACPVCGPRLEGRGGLEEGEGGGEEDTASAAGVFPPTPLHPFITCIASGGILALKAAGGFQLACDAHNEAAVQRLRQRKMRDGKPFAVMVPTLATARRYAVLSEAEAALLQRPERPIVLVRAREGKGLAEALAPGLAHLGLCLPSTPLHYALFYEALGVGRAVGGVGGVNPLARAGGPTPPPNPPPLAWLEEAHPLAWVMTSANLSGEPLAADNEEALHKLRGVADMFALHNRPIAVPMDDSVLQLAAGAPQMLRRARGFVPRPLPLPWQGPPLLAVGAQLKSTFCLVHNNRAYVSQHLGDLDNPEACASFRENVQHLCAQLKLRPALLVTDMHPDYFSTRWAEETGLPCLPIQHHVAHVAAVWAEYPALEGPLLGLALDGTGLGIDGLPWGGELLWLERGNRAGGEEGGTPKVSPGFYWERLGHLSPLLLPGGDAAARHPWRMGVALHLALGDEAKALAAGAAHGLTPPLLQAWKRQTLPAPPSTSLGRQWDAAAHLLGLCEVASYEAQAPMLLEALAHRAQGQALPWPLEGYGVEADNTLNLLGLLGQLEGRPPGLGALWLHEVVAKALGEWAGAEGRRRGVKHIALGGGCIQNRLLCEALEKYLRQEGLSPLFPRHLPPNDGAISMGQALLGTWHFSPAAGL